MIAGLPMYDLPGLEAHNDRLWAAVATQLRRRGVDAPLELSREPHTTLWTEPDLILGQTCGYPLVKHLEGRVKVIATPRYKARGCDGPFHRSLIIVRKNDPRNNLRDFRGARGALNDEASNTGMNLFRAEIAPLVRAGSDRFFDTVVYTGSHADSIDAVVDDEADIAAVDCITFALLQRLQPLTMERLRILAFTAQTPGLPLIASGSTPPEIIEAVADALSAAAHDPDLRPTLDALLIEGFNRLPPAYYRAVLHVEQLAISQGYPVLQ
jgi:ABC-type phosphate/phosphonate transport system substrate-binding protein